jgi:hypothetical protein
MKAITRCFPCLFLVVAGLLSGCSAPLQEYVSEKGGFRILLPGEPDPESQPDRPADIKSVKLLQRSGSYEVAWQDLAPAKGMTEDERLEKACDGAIKELGGKESAKEISRKPITLAGRYPGRELVTGLSNRDWVVKDRMYLVGSRLYHVVASGPKWWVESVTSRKVLGSFALTEE